MIIPDFLVFSQLKYLEILNLFYERKMTLKEAGEMNALWEMSVKDF